MKTKIIILIALIAISLGGCAKLSNSYKKTPDNFQKDERLKIEPVLSDDEVHTYEPITFFASSEQEPVGISRIDAYLYNEKNDQWETVEFTSTPKLDQEALIISGDPEVIIITPQITDDGSAHFLRLVFWTDQNLGQIVELSIKPFPLNADSISIKSQMPTILKMAQEWDQGAYLSEVRIFVPQNKETELILMTFEYQSSQSNTNLLLIDLYNNGRYQTTKGFYPNGIEQSKPLDINELVIDGQNALGIVLKEMSIQLPADHCFELNLKNNPETNQQNWILLESDCNGYPHIALTIDSITGEVIK